MKIHTTNYHNAFIEVAEDCPADQGIEPPLRGNKPSVANLQFEMLREQPYRFTSDEVFFEVYATRQDLSEGEREAARTAFFAKGQPCFRASPLTKRYGWGVHSDAEGRVALVGMEKDAYQAFAQNPELEVVKAMRSKRKA